ncbi:MAG: MltA domain-containing protein [Rhodospirillales bacterium]
MINRKLPAKLIIPLAAALLLSVLSACAQWGFAPDREAPEKFDTFLRLDAVNISELPGWVGDRQSYALVAFLRSCDKLEKLPPDRVLGPKMVPTRVADWLRACTTGRLIHPGNEAEARYFFESRFTPYRATSNNFRKGLFTGYYEPELHGSWQPDQTFRYPLYGRPKDLISINLEKFGDEYKGRTISGRLHKGAFVPFPTRAEIEAGALKGRGLELLWVDSAIDAFFMHVQGSGRIVMPDGSVIRAGFAGRNGQRYTPIGRELVARGILSDKKVSMQSIAQWIAAYPVAGQELMERNRSYIFFRLQDGDGPIGAQGVALTAGRSLAIDRKYIPFGVPIWLNTTEPGDSRKPFRRLLIAQDTGSAIKGPVRGDVFFGFGKAAGDNAGRMKEKGTYFLFLPK